MSSRYEHDIPIGQALFTRSRKKRLDERAFILRSFLNFHFSLFLDSRCFRSVCLQKRVSTVSYSRSWISGFCSVLPTTLSYSTAASHWIHGASTKESNAVSRLI